MSRRRRWMRMRVRDGGEKFDGRGGGGVCVKYNLEWNRCWWILDCATTVL